MYRMTMVTDDNGHMGGTMCKPPNIRYYFDMFYGIGVIANKYEYVIEM